MHRGIVSKGAAIRIEVASNIPVQPEAAEERIVHARALLARPGDSKVITLDLSPGTKGSMRMVVEADAELLILILDLPELEEQSDTPRVQVSVYEDQVKIDMGGVAVDQVWTYNAL